MQRTQVSNRQNEKLPGYVLVAPTSGLTRDLCVCMCMCGGWSSYTLPLQPATNSTYWSSCTIARRDSDGLNTVCRSKKVRETHGANQVSKFEPLYQQPAAKTRNAASVIYRTVTSKTYYYLVSRSWNIVPLQIRPLASLLSHWFAQHNISIVSSSRRSTTPTLLPIEQITPCISLCTQIQKIYK